MKHSLWKERLKTDHVRGKGEPVGRRKDSLPLVQFFALEEMSRGPPKL